MITIESCRDPQLEKKKSSQKLHVQSIVNLRSVGRQADQLFSNHNNILPRVFIRNRHCINHWGSARLHEPRIPRRNSESRSYTYSTSSIINFLFENLMFPQREFIQASRKFSLWSFHRFKIENLGWTLVELWTSPSERLVCTNREIFHQLKVQNVSYFFGTWKFMSVSA